MKTMTFLTAATVAAGLMASPAIAKDSAKQRTMMQNDSRMQMTDSNYRGNSDRDVGYRDGDYRSGMRADTGFWPGDVAAGAVGGAVGIAGAAVNTAGAIATAPFRPWNNSYASYQGPVDRYDTRDSYARRNNFVCQPGTWIRGEDGQRHICQ